MKYQYLAAILAILPMTGQGQLPTASSDLVDQLKTWELDQQVTLQQEMKEKRTKAVVLLQDYVEATTKTGNLEGALAIREQIEVMKQSAGKGPVKVGDLNGQKSAKLPENAEALLVRLAEWEMEQEANLEKQILVKREQVVGVLKNQLQNTAKEGDLDGAVAIRERILELSSPQSAIPGQGLFKGVKPGKVWTGIHPVAGGEWTIKLHPDGKATFKHGRIQNRLWAFEPPDILYCWHPNQTETTGWKLTGRSIRGHRQAEYDKRWREWQSPIAGQRMIPCRGRCEEEEVGRIERQRSLRSRSAS